jgi:hypothetical protein
MDKGKTKNRLTYNLAMPHVSIGPKELKVGSQGDICILIFAQVLVTKWPRGRSDENVHQ